MAIQVKKDMLQQTYSWKATGGDNPKAIRTDARLFNRHEGYEVVPMIQKVVDHFGYDSRAEVQRVETLIESELPGNVRGRKKVFDWLVGRGEARSEATNGQIYVQISFQDVTGTVNGIPLNSTSYTPIKWMESETPHLYSYIAYVVDRKTGVVVTSYAHSGPDGRTFHDDGDRDPGTTTVPDALKTFEGNTNYILIFLWASVIDEYGYLSIPSNLLAPSGDLMSFLLSCGASPGWHSFVNIDHYEIHGPGPYALIGICGSGVGKGVEGSVGVSIKQFPTREVPENPSVSLTVPLHRTDEGGSQLWAPSRL